jgi:Aldehyde dehydrogenase family
MTHELPIVLDRTTSGNVTINGTIMHVAQDDLPFGGVGASGMGAYHGVEGFRTLSHAKAIFEQDRWNFIELLRAPFGSLADTLLKFFLRSVITISRENFVNLLKPRRFRMRLGHKTKRKENEP